MPNRLFYGHLDIVALQQQSHLHQPHRENAVDFPYYPVKCHAVSHFVLVQQQYSYTGHRRHRKPMSQHPDSCGAHEKDPAHAPAFLPFCRFLIRIHQPAIIRNLLRFPSVLPGNPAFGNLPVGFTENQDIEKQIQRRAHLGHRVLHDTVLLWHGTVYAMEYQRHHHSDCQGKNDTHPGRLLILLQQYDIICPDCLILQQQIYGIPAGASIAFHHTQILMDCRQAAASIFLLNDPQRLPIQIPLILAPFNVCDCLPNDLVHPALCKQRPGILQRA